MPYSDLLPPYLPRPLPCSCHCLIPLAAGLVAIILALGLLFLPPLPAATRCPAVATATMPLAAGLVGIIPALGLLTPEEHPAGPVTFTPWQLLAWCSAVAFFGVFVAVPLRHQTIIREKLRFPSGTATASVIRTLHGLPPQQQEEGDEADWSDRVTDSVTGGSWGSNGAAAAAYGLGKQRQSDEGGLLEGGPGGHTQQQQGRGRIDAAGQPNGSSSGSGGSNNTRSSQVDLEVAVWVVSADRHARIQVHSA